MDEAKGGRHLAQQPARGGKTALIVLTVLALALAAAYAGLCAWAGSQDTFYPNCTINGVDVAGLTVEQAQAKLESDLFSRRVTVTDSATEQELAVLSLEELGCTPEAFSGEARFRMDDLKRGGYPAAGWTYLKCLLGRRPGGSHWPDMDSETLNATAERLSAELSRPAADAGYRLNGDRFVTVTRALDGRLLSPETLADSLGRIEAYSQSGWRVPVAFAQLPARDLSAQEIHDEIYGVFKNASYDPETERIVPEQLGVDFDVPAAQDLLDAAAPGEEVDIPAEIRQPLVTAEALETLLFRDVLGQARTKVTGTAGRISNVKLAGAAIDGKVLNSGEVFSYNETVGERTAAGGYRLAPAYIRGETVDTIGGGVCQPSSTLYLACLLANLEIVERTNHRYAPSYIDWGMDATVSWNTLDYKFANSTLYPLKIESTYEKGWLTVRLLGTNIDGTSAKVTNEVLSSTPWETVYQEDSTLPPGSAEVVKTTPYTGYKVQTYHTIYDAAGNVIDRHLEARSTYSVRNKVVLVPPAAAASAPTVPALPDEPALPTLSFEPLLPDEPAEGA